MGIGYLGKGPRELVMKYTGIKRATNLFACLPPLEGMAGLSLNSCPCQQHKRPTETYYPKVEKESPIASILEKIIDYGNHVVHKYFMFNLK